jgi:hypothetical protein
MIFKNKCTEIDIRYISVERVLKALSRLFLGVNMRLRHVNKYFLEVLEPHVLYIALDHNTHI